MRESERKALKRAELRAQGLAIVTVAVPMAHRAWLLDAARELREGLPPAEIGNHTPAQPVSEPLNASKPAAGGRIVLEFVDKFTFWLLATICGGSIIFTVFELTVALLRHYRSI